MPKFVEGDMVMVATDTTSGLVGFGHLTTTKWYSDVAYSGGV